MSMNAGEPERQRKTGSSENDQAKAGGAEGGMEGGSAGGPGSNGGTYVDEEAATTLAAPVGPSTAAPGESY